MFKVLVEAIEARRLEKHQTTCRNHSQGRCKTFISTVVETVVADNRRSLSRPPAALDRLLSTSQSFDKGRSLLTAVSILPHQATHLPKTTIVVPSASHVATEFRSGFCSKIVNPSCFADMPSVSLDFPGIALIQGPGTLFDRVGHESRYQRSFRFLIRCKRGSDLLHSLWKEAFLISAI